MKFKLNHVIPAPIAEQLNDGTEIWGKQLELNPEEYIQITAPSGKGKSTFIQILYGNRKDYKGQVFYDDLDIRSLSSNKISEFRKTKVSIVFQELLLFAELSGWENLKVKSRLTDYYSKDKILQMTEELEISHLLEKKCGLMSFGERQRFAIVRSLIQPFSWLLMDEPFSHLDENNMEKASAMIIQECKSREAGLILTSLDGDKFIDFNRELKL